MNSSSAITSSPQIWHGPGAADRERQHFEWKRLLWALVFPPKRHRITVTIPGLFLMGLSLGIGTAAYNTASNILFITLSLLLACLLLSGLLSWFNFMGISWRLPPAGPWRAGHETLIPVQVKNEKKWLPCYGLWFDFAVQPRAKPMSEQEEKEMNVREVLKAFEKSFVRGRVAMRERLEPGGEATAEWAHKPMERGIAHLELVAVGSLFPFGFLKKNIGAGLKQKVLVWPAQIEYLWRGGTAAQAGIQQGRRTPRAGTGEDLLALRRYAQGDSHRLIHWKASARLGQMMVRQFAAECRDGYTLHIATPATLWSRPEQFELLCSFAGTLAEDLFATGRLQGVAVNGGAVREIQKVRDVDAFLDELAGLQPCDPAESAAATRSIRNVITFAPEGARGVIAYVDGSPTASA